MKNERLADFLSRHHFVFESDGFEAICGDFVEEMEKGLHRPEGSLKMIPTYIRVDTDIDFTQNVVVMDAGGTNFRVSLVHFDADRKPVIDYLRKYPMPGSEGVIGREEFYRKIVEYLSPVIHKSNKIGFCFSYPTEILPNKDGKLIHFNKEVKIDGLDGTRIGEGVLRALADHGCTEPKSIVLLNDTVATLLGGKASVNDRVFDSYIGFILGTGTNTCYIEEDANIAKDPSISGLPGSMIVNIESGGYARAPRSDFDDRFDTGTETPGAQLFEKMVSGAYQGGLLLTILRTAADEELFSHDTAQNIRRIPQLSSKEIDQFCYYPYGDNALARAAVSDSDKLTIYEITDAFYERAALLVAANLAAVMRKTGKGNNPLRPVCVSAEGTTFYKSKLFRPKLDKLVATLLNREQGLYCEFVKSDSTTIVGTALAAILG